MIMTALLQLYGALSTMYFLALPQFFFVAFSRYYTTFTGDIKSIINGFYAQNADKLRNNFIAMINLHRRSLW